MVSCLSEGFSSPLGSHCVSHSEKRNRKTSHPSKKHLSRAQEVLTRLPSALGNTPWGLGVGGGMVREALVCITGQFPAREGLQPAPQTPGYLTSSSLASITGAPLESLDVSEVLAEPRKHRAAAPEDTTSSLRFTARTHKTSIRTCRLNLLSPK